jgi:hypothetical protein
MPSPWTDVERAVFAEFVTLIEGPPYENWVQMAAQMNDAVQRRQLACREFTATGLRLYCQRAFKKGLPVQAKRDWEDGMMKEALNSLSQGWKWADLVEIMNQKIVAQGLGGVEYYSESYIIFRYKLFYGKDAAKRKERFPARFPSSMEDEQADKDEGEDLGPPEGESSTAQAASQAARSTYLTWEEMTM